jgi:cardiolipin synthase
MNLTWLWIYLLPTVEFIFALLLLSHVIKERRSPTSTLAWLMGIIFIPYLGVPLYLILGGRKILRKAEAKPEFPQFQDRSASTRQNTALRFNADNGWFPATSTYRIKFLTKGDQAFQEIMALLQNAKSHIFITTFIIGSDETGRAIIDLLARKASSGLEVCLLLDALGSAKINSRFVAPLQAAGGQVAFFMPVLHLPFRGRANLRNHRKMIIIDGHAAVIGGMNLAREYLGPHASQDRWQDLSLLIQGPVTGHLSAVFRADWKFASGRELSEFGPNDTKPAVTSEPKPQAAAPPADISTILDFQTDATVTQPPGTDLTHANEDMHHHGVVQLVASGPDVRNDSLRNEILTAIFRADRRVWIVTPYFVPDESLVEALCIAACRQIDVSIVIPQKSNHYLADLVRESYLTQLQSSGVRVWLYQPRMLHAKAILVDESLAIIGSANLDMRSLLLNYEIALFVHDAQAIRQVDTWIQGLETDCKMRGSRPRSGWNLIEGVGRLFAPLL